MYTQIGECAEKTYKHINEFERVDEPSDWRTVTRRDGEKQRKRKKQLKKLFFFSQSLISGIDNRYTCNSKWGALP